MTNLRGNLTITTIEDGINSATVLLYHRTSGTPNSAPAANTTYDFTTKVLSGSLGSWSQTIPADNGSPCYVTMATAASNTETDTILPSEWSTVRKLVSSGSNGIDAITVEISNQNQIVDADGNAFNASSYIKVLRGNTYLTPTTEWTLTHVNTGVTDDGDSAGQDNFDQAINFIGFTLDTVVVGTVLLTITVGTVVIQRIITVARNNKFIVYPRGIYSATAQYVGNAFRREIVKYNGFHYITKITAGSIAIGTLPTVTAKWEAANDVEFIATGLLFAENGFIGIQSSNKIVIYDASNNIVGGMTGEGVGDTAWRFWLGGSTPSTSPTRITQGGKTYLLDAVIEGILRTAESGARIEFSKAGNSINIFDAAGLARLILAPRNVIPFANLTGSASTDTTTFSAHTTELEVDDTTNIGATETLVLDTGKYYDITTPPVNWNLAATGYYDGYLKNHYPGVAAVSVTLFDVTNNRAIWTTAASVTSDSATQEEDFGTIASHTVRGVAGSTFRMDVVISITHAYPAAGYALASIATGATMTGTTIVSFAELGWNGFNFVNDLAHMFHYGSTDGLIYRGAIDMPGMGLCGGSVSSVGGHSGGWGTMVGGSTKAGSTVTITHTINDTNYSIRISPTSSATWYWQSKSSTSIQIVTTGAFEYELVRTI